MSLVRKRGRDKRQDAKREKRFAGQRNERSGISQGRQTRKQTQHTGHRQEERKQQLRDKFLHEDRLFGDFFVLNHIPQIGLDFRNSGLVCGVHDVNDAVDEGEVIFPNVSDPRSTSQIIDLDGKLVYLFHFYAGESDCWHNILSRALNRDASCKSLQVISDHVYRRADDVRRILTTQ